MAPGQGCLCRHDAGLGKGNGENAIMGLRVKWLAASLMRYQVTLTTVPDLRDLAASLAFGPSKRHGSVG